MTFIILGVLGAFPNKNAVIQNAFLAMDRWHLRATKMMKNKPPFICAYSCSGIKVCAIICLRHNLNKNFLSWENYFGKKCFPFYSCRDGKRLCRNNKGQHFFGASLVGAHFLICSYFMLCKFREINIA